NTKKGISDRIKKLRELDLIETHQTKDNSLYVRITAKAINVNYDQKNSEQNPPVNPQVNTPVNPRVNTPVNPRVNSTNSNTNKQNTNKQREKETSPAAAQNGKPATQPTANNKFLSLDFFEKNLTENHPLIKGATALKITPETKRKIKAIPPEHRQRVINAHQNYKKSDMVKDGAINHLHTWLEEWEIWEPSATAPGNTGDKISIYFRDSNKT
ncbi:MAG: hypothetical protein KDH95_24305, partial [Calditrichaeota bacterium]|nr:hypothetical protein [Calditrichota bacterium]